MSMNIQDMAAVMAAKNEAFRGTEQVAEKVTISACEKGSMRTVRSSSMWNFRSPSAF